MNKKTLSKLAKDSKKFETTVYNGLFNKKPSQVQRGHHIRAEYIWLMIKDSSGEDHNVNLQALIDKF